MLKMPRSVTIRVGRPADDSRLSLWAPAKIFEAIPYDVLRWAGKLNFVAWGIIPKSKLSNPFSEAAYLSWNSARHVNFVDACGIELVCALKLSRAVMRNIRQNLFFAFFYNVLGVPLAVDVLYPFTGWLLNPMIAGAAMALSSVSVSGTR